MGQYDFGGWATKNDLKCSDGRTIRKDAFKHCDGMTVPLVWGHQHNDPLRVLGHALLENREEGVYTYGKFNETEAGKNAKLLVEHGDVVALSIYANQLKEQGGDVLHGAIREVSLVLAGANPGAFIDSVMAHGEDAEYEATIYTGEGLELVHSDDEEEDDEDVDVEDLDIDDDEEDEEDEEELSHADDDKKDDKKDDDKKDDESEDDKTIQEVLDTYTEDQKNVLYYLIGEAIKSVSGESDENKKEENIKHSEGGDNNMKNNVFDQADQKKETVLSHEDQGAILELAKRSSVGSLKQAIATYLEENKTTLKHDVFGEEDMESLFPELKNLNPGAPELVRPDQSWVMGVINKIHKSPFSRIKTRQADARIAELRAKGYQKKGDQKTISASIKLIGRETTPQTVYRKDELHRDDIVDITGFDIVNYQWALMKDNMYEELALAALVGDGRDDGDPDKIQETHIRSIWNDEELYTIHKDVDIEAAKAELQGSETGAHFGDNYIYAEAMITAALYAREQFKGSGTPDLYCAPHLVNVMLLARDLNGRRIYDSKADLAKALNVGAIHEIEQLEGKVRTTEGGDKKKLLGLFVNLADYTFGSTKGGELTRFDDFDIDFNKYKYLMETRLCGALTKVQSAIALEEPVDEVAG